MKDQYVMSSGEYKHKETLICYIFLSRFNSVTNHVTVVVWRYHFYNSEEVSCSVVWIQLLHAQSASALFSELHCCTPHSGHCIHHFILSTIPTASIQPYSIIQMLLCLWFKTFTLSLAQFVTALSLLYWTICQLFIL